MSRKLSAVILQLTTVNAQCYVDPVETDQKVRAVRCHPAVTSTVPPDTDPVKLIIVKTDTDENPELNYDELWCRRIKCTARAIVHAPPNLQIHEIMIWRANLKIISVLTTVLCMGTVVTDWIGIFHHRSHTTNSAKLRDNSLHRPSSIGKLSMLYGETNTLYERALAAHLPHNQKFGYSMYVLREKTLPGYWSKPAYFLEQLLAELALPEDKRLKWLVYVPVCAAYSAVKWLTLFSTVGSMVTLS